MDGRSTNWQDLLYPKWIWTYYSLPQSDDNFVRKSVISKCYVKNKC